MTMTMGNKVIRTERRTTNDRSSRYAFHVTITNAFPTHSVKEGKKEAKWKVVLSHNPVRNLAVFKAWRGIGRHAVRQDFRLTKKGNMRRTVGLRGSKNGAGTVVFAVRQLVWSEFGDSSLSWL